MAQELYQVWYKTHAYSGWELFNTDFCVLETAQAIARCLPLFKITRPGESPDGEEAGDGQKGQ